MPFPPEFVVIALSIFLLCMDLIKGKTEGKIHIAMAGLMELGKWALVGFFFNTITVVLGILAYGWAGSETTNPIQSVFLPVFEFVRPEVPLPMYFSGLLEQFEC